MYHDFLRLSAPENTEIRDAQSESDWIYGLNKHVCIQIWKIAIKPSP